MRGPAAVLALALAAAAAPNPLHGDLPFAATLESGRAEAQWRGKPLLVFYSLKGDDASLRVAGTAFKDAEVVARASAFVPVLVDADADERFGLERGVKTVPTILLLDPRGREAGRAAGNAGPAEVLLAMDEALKRIGTLNPPKEARDLAKAASALEKGLAKGEWKTVLKSAQSIEKIGHAGPELDAARKAVAAAAEEAGRRLAAAKKLVKDGKRDEARAEFRRIVRDFPGLDAAVEAKNLLKEMDGPDGGDDEGGGEGGGEKGKHGKSGQSGGRHAPPKHGAH